MLEKFLYDCSPGFAVGQRPACQQHIRTSSASFVLRCCTGEGLSSGNGHAYIHTSMHTSMHTYKHTCIHTYILAYTHAYTHAYTDTQNKHVSFYKSITYWHNFTWSNCCQHPNVPQGKLLGIAMEPFTTFFCRKMRRNQSQRPSASWQGSGHTDQHK